MKIQTASSYIPPALPRTQGLGAENLKDKVPSDDHERFNGALDGLSKTAMLGGASYLAGSAYPTIYLHELGHKIAAEQLYSNPRTSITVNPFKGGAMRWYPSALSPLGEKLGANGARAAVAAAGPAVDVLTSVALFGAGYKLRKKHPMVGHAMMGYAGMNMANITAYAASGIGKTLAQSAGHDFLNLQAFAGIPPWVSMVALASILPAQYLIMRALED